MVPILVAWVIASVLVAFMWGAIIRMAERRRVQTAAKSFAGCDQALAQGDTGDETDVATEGLGTYPPPQRVRDGWLISLGELHPHDQEVFGPARRAS